MKLQVDKWHIRDVRVTELGRLFNHILMYIYVCIYVFFLLYRFIYICIFLYVYVYMCVELTTQSVSISSDYEAG